LFFCAFPALLRGDIAPGLSVLFGSTVIGIFAYAVGLPTWLSTAIIGGIWGFFYNDIHRERLLRAGYEPVARHLTLYLPALALYLVVLPRW
jgi:hypothetical protein